MASFKYSYVFWGLFGVFIVALWVSLYVGCVIPIENSEKFKRTQCTTVDGRTVGHEKCPCTSTSDERCGKSFQCLQIFVNFTIPNAEAETKLQQRRQEQLHFAENSLQSNCSYQPFCGSSQESITYETTFYYHKRGQKGTVFPCLYNQENERQVIDVNYNGRRLAVLVPFAIVLLVMIFVTSLLLYRRGCGCNRKRRPSRLSFVSAVDEC